MKKRVETDVDIDLADRDQLVNLLNPPAALIVREKEEEKHKTGVYFQDIPFDPQTNVATIDYKKAEEYGYFKIDFLNVSLYQDVKSETHLVELITREPQWELLEYKEVVEKLFHINNYHYLTSRLKPRTVEELAMILAIIRPSKKYLQKEKWDKIKAEVWQKPKDGYHFKRAHAISYAMAIVVQLNLIVEGLG